MIIYSIKDDKAQAWQGAYSFVNDAIAIREFQSAFNGGKLGLMNECPQDFALYRVAVMDQDTGAVKPDLVLVKNFADFVTEAKNNG